MNVITKTLFCQVPILVFLAVILNSCEKDDEIIINQTNGKTTSVFNPDLLYGTMTDQDGNIYKTIYINGQTWMAENLRTTKYRNGDVIPQVVDSIIWTSLITGAVCSYKNTENIDTIASYGRLYNWYAVSDPRNLAPIGWHVATHTEWRNLINLLSDGGNDSLAVAKLREIGNFHWYVPDELYATNESGMTILPSGARDPYTGKFVGMGYLGIFWSSTQADDFYAWRINIYSSKYYRLPGHYQSGFAIRCVKD